VADIGTQNWSNFFYWDLNGNPRCLVCEHIISWACRFCTPPTFIRMRDTIQCLETHITLAHPEINNIESLSLPPSLFDNDRNSSSFSSPVHWLIVARLQRSSQEQHNFLRQTLLRLTTANVQLLDVLSFQLLKLVILFPLLKEVLKILPMVFFYERIFIIDFWNRNSYGGILLTLSSFILTFVKFLLNILCFMANHSHKIYHIFNLITIQTHLYLLNGFI
jgi:hypothetical protein